METQVSKELSVKRAFSAGTDEDSSVGLRVQYIGSEAYASVEVTSSGDIVFLHGASVETAAADTTIDSALWDVGIAAGDGTIDVSDSSNMTAKEVMDVINMSPNWRCFLEGLLPDDNMNASTGTLLLMPATQANSTTYKEVGLPLYIDGSKLGIGMSFAITGCEFKSSTSRPGHFLDGFKNDDNCINYLDFVGVTVTVGNAAALRVYEASQKDTSGTLLLTNALSNATYAELRQYGSNGILRSTLGKRLIVRYTDTGTPTITVGTVSGRVVDYGCPRLS